MIAETLSSLLISPMDFLESLYLITEVRAKTLRPAIFESAEISSSVIPSEKISSLASELMLASGRTAIRRLPVGRCSPIAVILSFYPVVLGSRFIPFPRLRLVIHPLRDQFSRSPSQFWLILTYAIELLE